MKTGKNIYVILLLGLLLRLISLNQSLWLDEATSAQVIRNFSFSEIVTKFSVGDFHPPFYYLLLKIWSYIFGSSEIGLRSLSVLLGISTVFVTYLIGKEISKKAGILAALFLSVNGLHIYYSQEARMYVLSAFLVCSAVYFFIKTLNSNNILYWILFSLTLALNSVTDYLPNLIIPVLWIAASRLKKDGVWWRNFLLSHLFLLLTWLYWLPNFIKQLNLGLSVSSVTPQWWEILGKTNMKNILLIPVKFVFGRISFENNIVYFAVAASVLSVYALIIFIGFRRFFRQKHSLFVDWLLVPLIVSAIIGMKIPVFYYFRFLFVLPAFLLCLAQSVYTLPEKLRKPAVILIFLISILSSFYYLLNPKFQREDWRGAVRYIVQNSQRGDYRVVFSSGNQTEAYLYYGDGAEIIKADDLRYGGDKVWLIRYLQDLFDPEDNANTKIERIGYEKTEEHYFNGIMVWEYKK